MGPDLTYRSCRKYTDRPHVAGSEIQLEYGERIAKEWKKHEFDKVETFRYNVLLSYMEEGETNVVKAFNDVGGILHEFRGKEKVLRVFSIQVRGGLVQHATGDPLTGIQF